VFTKQLLRNESDISLSFSSSLPSNGSIRHNIYTDMLNKTSATLPMSEADNAIIDIYMIITYFKLSK
jgi:hypothetical protein